MSLRQPDFFDRRIAQLPPRLRWAAGAARLAVRDPADGLDRVVVRARERMTRRRRDRPRYVPEADWHERVHEQLGLAWPCETAASFEELWTGVATSVRERGGAIGRGAYSGWDDGDPGLARAVLCLMSHLHPDKVVETGVARGVTSRIILEALDGRGAGHLWSIDLPAMDPTLHGEIGIAVPDRLRVRWTYISGTSRRRLPKLLGGIAPIDLFVHDSSHTERNVRFELQTAWPALRRGGAVVVDDVQQSPALAGFAAATPDASAHVARADDGRALFGVLLKAA